MHEGELMTIVLNIALGLLFAAAALVLVRMAMGPASFDRALSVDVLIVIVTGIIATQVVRTGDAGSLPILVVFSLTGFVGSVAIARFMGRKDDPQ